MVERVARAIEIEIGKRRPDEMMEPYIESAARAAIEAMRELTPEVMAAGVEEDFEGQEANVRDVWRAMIDAALSTS